MDSGFPERWHRMDSYRRNILAALVRDGPAIGREVHDAAGGYEGRQHESQVYAVLDELEDEGLVEKGKRDERTNEYDATGEAMALVDRAGETLTGGR